MGNLITQQFLRGKKSYKAPKCSKMALDLECTNTGMNCTFVWVFSKERTQTLGGQKVVKSIESEDVHANVILNETSVYTDRKRIWVRHAFSTAFHLFHPTNQRSILCAVTLTTFPVKPKEQSLQPNICPKTQG